MSKPNAASIILSWGWSWNNDPTSSTVCSLVRGLSFPPLREIFALSMNRVCHCMILLRPGGFFLIRVRTQRCVLVTDWFRTYSAKIPAFSWGVKRTLVSDFDFEVCLFFLGLQLNMEHRCKAEEVCYNPSKTQQEMQNISTMSIKSKERSDDSNQTKRKN